jgi:hypothetical protein
MKDIALALTVLLVAGSAYAYPTTILRQGGDLDGDGALAVEFDMLTIIDDAEEEPPGTGATHQQDYYVEASDPNYCLIGVADLMDYLPTNSADLISCTLTIVQYWGDNDYLEAYRVTTPWMYLANGQNEDTTTWYQAYTQGEGTPWSAGDFSTADYTTEDMVHVDFDDNVYAEPYDYDVTAQVLDMYTEGNNGWVVFSEPGLSVNSYANDNSTVSRQPYITIVVVPEPVTIGLLAIGGIAFLRRRRR